MPNSPQDMILQQLLGGRGGSQMDMRAEARGPTDNPMLYESPLFQEAVQMFIEQNGTEPATDGDFEGPGGVLDIMMSLRDGDNNDPRARVLSEMGEGGDRVPEE